jgi:hypothetical protein
MLAEGRRLARKTSSDTANGPTLKMPTLLTIDDYPQNAYCLALGNALWRRGSAVETMIPTAEAHDSSLRCTGPGAAAGSEPYLL